MIEDHVPITIANFRGLFDRGEDEIAPLGFWISSQNNVFMTNGFGTREGSVSSLTVVSVKRIKSYKRVGEVDRLLILDGEGNLYDSTNLSTPILSIAAMTDFSAVTMFNRAYITPHDGVTGLPGECVYVYEGSGVARPAAGSPPSGFTLSLTDSASSGKLEAGLRAVGVCFETVSGYLTKPGGFSSWTAAGSKKLDVGSLPIGSAGTVARVLVATKLITGFAGDYQNQTYYIVPDGRVGNNSAASVAGIDFYDADLQEEASDLMEQLATIPAGVGIGNYEGQMIVWGENANQSVIRVSQAGEPESHNEVEGYITINPGDASTGVKDCGVYRRQLGALKGGRCYVTQMTENPAAYWDVGDVDMSVGTEPHGILQVNDYGQIVDDMMLVVSRSGLRIFNGTFAIEPLTRNIDNLWKRINRAAFHTIEGVIDSEQSRIYLVVPLDAATAPSHLLYGDYSEGLTADTIKWDVWVFPNAPQTLAITTDSTTKRPVLKFGVAAGNVYALDSTATNDYNTAIDCWCEFPPMPDVDDQKINHFHGIRLRARGVGTIAVTVSGLDDAQVLTPAALPITLAPGGSYFRGFIFVSEKASVKLRMTTVNNWYRILKFALYAQPIWTSKAQG